MDRNVGPAVGVHALPLAVSFKGAPRGMQYMGSTTRAYGAAIAVTSGLYSLWSATAAPATSGGSLMLAVGLIVLVHGVGLLTPFADRLGNASGPLMIGYAIVMLAIQGLLATGMMAMDDSMGMTGNVGGASMTGGMAWTPAWSRSRR